MDRPSDKWLVIGVGLVVALMLVMAQQEIEKRPFVNRRKEARHIEPQRPRVATPVGRDTTEEELHQPIARRQYPLVSPAGIRIAVENRLEEAFLVPDEEVMDDAVAEVGGEHAAAPS